MKRLAALPLEAIVALYFLSYLPNVMFTRWAATSPNLALGRPLTGLETLPASLTINFVLTLLFIWASGWHRDAHAVQLGRWRVPCPTRLTFLAGIGSALVLFTVPLSYTFQGVSIPFIQLVMRGDILVIAPLVDLAFSRRVRWWSWVALGMVLLALLITVTDRGGLKLPPLAIATVVLYTIGYFIRLAVMTRIGKNGDAATVRRYFVEEKIVALPLAIGLLAAISASGLGGQAGELHWGFVAVWSDPVIWILAGIGTSLTVVSVFAIIILLDARENAYCVPLERAASLIAGVGGSLLLALWFAGKMARPAEFIGAGILVAAIVLLSLAPRRAGRREAA